MNIGILDIIILVVIAASAVMGIFKGFVRQLASIAAIILGMWCAGKFTGYLSSLTKEWLHLEMSQQTLHIIMFAVIFIAVLVLAHFLGKLIEGLVKLSMLGWLNRILGLLFGAMKAIVILSVAVYAVNWLNGMFHIIPQDFLDNSKGYGLLATFAKEFFPFLHNMFS